jgi:hypothetical protein
MSSLVRAYNFLTSMRIQLSSQLRACDFFAESARSKLSSLNIYVNCVLCIHYNRLACAQHFFLAHILCCHYTPTPTENSRYSLMTHNRVIPQGTLPCSFLGRACHAEKTCSTNGNGYSLHTQLFKTENLGSLLTLLL